MLEWNGREDRARRQRCLRTSGHPGRLGSAETGLAVSFQAPWGSCNGPDCFGSLFALLLRRTNRSVAEISAKTSNTPVATPAPIPAFSPGDKTAFDEVADADKPIFVGFSAAAVELPVIVTVGVVELAMVSVAAVDLPLVVVDKDIGLAVMSVAALELLVGVIVDIVGLAIAVAAEKSDRSVCFHRTWKGYATTQLLFHVFVSVATVACVGNVSISYTVVVASRPVLQAHYGCSLDGQR